MLKVLILVSLSILNKFKVLFNDGYEDFSPYMKLDEESEESIEIRCGSRIHFDLGKDIGAINERRCLYSRATSK